jgi:hypothetical protein
MIQPFFLSVDSFLAASALGALGLNQARRRALVLAFALCDGTASFAGLHLHLASLTARANQPLSLAIMASCWILFVAFLTYRMTAKGRVSVLELSLLPFILCLDNLFGTPLAPGIAAHTLEVPCLTGMISGVLAFAGYQAGSLFIRWAPSRLTVGLSSGLLLLLPLFS